jgi:hypothetical protein
MQKRCGRCGVEKPLDAFHRRGAVRQAWCKECRRVYDAAYHRATRAVRLEQKRIRRAHVWVWYRSLKQKPCADCGGSFHHSAMHWDHLPGAEKQAEVSILMKRTQSKRRVLQEIAKCELVCANCHAVRSFERRRSSSNGV